MVLLISDHWILSCFAKLWRAHINWMFSAIKDATILFDAVVVRRAGAPAHQDDAGLAAAAKVHPAL
ncbi:hypothetical protein [Mycobacterium interjectum]|uniref:hypothetical protein n=1 Tax=Mycobacterium interjectum TaxID=33895 RepID=UPI000AE66A71|nr:hypothetical protein [Mycobacterium interjectum]MCV7091143.1 hypothetical protein [Mycobacterium interjectum]